MKIFAHLVLRSALLALLALFIGSASSHAQTLVSTETSVPEQAKVNPVRLIAESPEPIAREGISASEAVPRNYLLHVSDRAQRGRTEFEATGDAGILPELSDATPAPARHKLGKEIVGKARSIE